MAVNVTRRAQRPAGGKTRKRPPECSPAANSGGREAGRVRGRVNCLGRRFERIGPLTRTEPTSRRRLSWPGWSTSASCSSCPLSSAVPRQRDVIDLRHRASSPVAPGLNCDLTCRQPHSARSSGAVACPWRMKARPVRSQRVSTSAGVSGSWTPSGEVLRRFPVRCRICRGSFVDQVRVVGCGLPRTRES